MQNVSVYCALLVFLFTIQMIGANVSTIGTEKQLEMEIPCNILCESNNHKSQVKWYLNDSEIDIDNVIFKVSILLAYSTH